MTSTKVFYVFVFILVSFLFNTKAYSQENFIPGSIFTLNGDTIKGMIDSRSWEKNPVTVSFKESASGKVIDHNPLTIRGFRTEKDIFMSGIIQAEASPYKSNELTYKTEIIKRTDTAFVQVIFQGSKNLYSYIDRNGNQQFYINQWPDFDLLIHKKYLMDNTEKSSYDFSKPNVTIKENNNYKGQLILYLTDCPSVQSEMKSTTYTLGSLLDLFNTYEKCTYKGTNNAKEAGYKYNKGKVKTEFGIVVSPLLAKIDLLGLEYGPNAITNIHYPVSLGLGGGVNFNIVFPANQGRYSIYNELLVSSYQSSADFEIPGIWSPILIETQLGFTQLKFNSCLRYKIFTKNDWSIFANAGFQYAYTLAEVNSYEDKQNNKSGTLADVAPSEFKYNLGIGSGYKKFSFETRYEFGGELSLYTNTSLTSKLIYFMFGYRF